MQRLTGWSVSGSTVYDMMRPTGVNYLGFMAWIGLWSLLFHWVLAVTNSCNWLRWVTRFPCDIFGFYVAFVYLQKGGQVLERLGDGAPFYLSMAVALLVLMAAHVCAALAASGLFTHPVRVFLKDYGTPLTVVFFAGFVHLGRMGAVPLETLPTGRAFAPTAARAWLVDFWDVSVAHVFLAVPFAVLLTILFWFDHNVSSLMAQGTEFPLRKPAGFHWDLFLLGLTTGLAGLLGLPFPNGLIPQAPFHTEALCVTEVVADADADEGGDNKGHMAVQRTRVVEQRASHLAQGLLTLGTMTAPLLGVLHRIPQGVLAGLFFAMGLQALAANGMTATLAFLARDAALTPPGHPLRAPRRARVWLFAALQLAAFAATFAITQTPAAVGFPVCILALVPARAGLLPRWFAPAELAALDAPTAAPLAMQSVGGGAGGVWAAGGAPHSAARESEAELAERGELQGQPARGPRRRSSAAGTTVEGAAGGREEEGEGFEMARLGVSRRQTAASRASAE